MAGFSIDAALKSGFRLARREWKTVLAWGAGALVLSCLGQLAIMGPALPAYLRDVGGDPEGAAAALEAATAATALITFPIYMIIAYGVAAVFYGAVARALLRPEQRGFLYLRVGRGELWLMLTLVALFVLAVAIMTPVALAVIAAVAGISAMGGNPWLWGFMLGAPALAGVFYLAARVAPAWVMAWDEERFALADAWRLTRGQGWRIVLLFLTLIFLLIIVAVIVIVPLALVAFILLAVAGMAGEGAALGMGIVLVLAALVVACAYYGALYTVSIAPYVELYRELKAGQAAAGT